MIDGMLQFFKMRNGHPISYPLQSRTDRSLRENNALLSDVTLHQQMIGLLLSLSCTTRPDSLYAARYLSGFTHKPTGTIWKTAISVLHYWKGSKTLGITYKSSSENSITSFSGAEWGGEKPT